MKKIAATLAVTATVGATLVSGASAMHARPHAKHFHGVPARHNHISRWNHRFVA